MRTVKIAAAALASALLAGTAGVAAAQDAGPVPPKQFFMMAEKGNNSEIMLGRMAETKGASKGTRDYGAMLVHDHTMLQQQAAPYALNLGVPPTREPTQEALEERTRLEGLSGAAFDQEFARYMAADHEKDIAKFQAEASSGEAPASTVAQKALPVLHKHLRVAQELVSSGR